MLATRFFRFRQDTRGVAAVEAGLAFPFILIFAGGLFEYGAIFYNFELVQNGVRDAARYLARVPDPVAAETAARNLALRGTVDATGTVRVKSWQPGDITITYETTPNPVDSVTKLRVYRGGEQLTVVRVSTAFDYDGLGLLKSVGLGSIRVSAAHEDRHVGQ